MPILLAPTPLRLMPLARESAANRQSDSAQHQTERPDTPATLKDQDTEKYMTPENDFR